MDVSEATTEDLVKELTERCPAGLVLLVVPDDGEQTATVENGWGHPCTILGMAVAVTESVKRRLMRSASDGNPPQVTDG